VASHAYDESTTPGVAGVAGVAVNTDVVCDVAVGGREFKDEDEDEDRGFKVAAAAVAASAAAEGNADDESEDEEAESAIDGPPDVLATMPTLVAMVVGRRMEQLAAMAVAAATVGKVLGGWRSVGKEMGVGMDAGRGVGGGDVGGSEFATARGVHMAARW
jgi:hypothetical protein